MTRSTVVVGITAEGASMGGKPCNASVGGSTKMGCGMLAGATGGTSTSES